MILGVSSPVERTGNSPMTKEQHIAEIVELLKACNDIPLLDLIKKLLVKSI